MKIGTLFSGGLAAPEFALKYLGIDHEVVFACEWDKYARKQYLHFHGEPNAFYNNIDDMDGNPYKNKIDLLIWGSSCQDFSINGNRKGIKGSKSKYFLSGIQRQKEIMPKVFIFENVRGMQTSNNGEDFKLALKSFIDMGYKIKHTLLNTRDYGLPQRRERIFVVGFLNEKDYNNFEFPQKEDLKLKLKDILEDEVNEKYIVSNKILDGFCHITENGEYQIKTATKLGYQVAMKNDSINFSFPKSPTRRGRVGKGVAQTLDCACNQGIIYKGTIRKFTPKECFRLQGLKDEDIKLIVSDSQAYKIAGNAISITPIMKIIKNIVKGNKNG